MSDGRSGDTDALRRMVREVLAEVLPRDAAPDVRRVTVRDDRELADLVTQVLRLARDPARAADLESGRIRFTLATGDSPAGVASATTPGAVEVERGAVTERVVQRAAREQRPLLIGPRAVVTPLARDRARALGVTIERRDTR
jgi:hypothetical protein